MCPGAGQTEATAGICMPEKRLLTRAPISMGAVGASAPTVFESGGASTHGFWQLFSHFH